MPDPMPEHPDNPPQWPPLTGYDSPTVPPERADDEPGATSTEVADDSGSASRVTVPAQAGAPDEPPRETGEHPLPVQLPAVGTSAKTTPAVPDTHGRGVRMAIYGIGGAIVVSLIAVIVVMAGGGLVPSGDDAETPTDRLLAASGEVDAEQYAKLAEVAGDEEWIEWRYGATGENGDDVAEVKQPKTSRLTVPGSDIESVYQHGDGSAPDDPRNVQGQVGYVSGGGDASADHVTTVETTDSSIGYTPRPGGRFTAEASDPDLTGDAFAKCADGDPGRLMAAERSHGRGYAAHAVLAYSSGVIATSGVSGAQQGTCLRLPQGQLPTAVAVTPGNEFALVSVWDTGEVRGRLAVIALADRPGTYGSSWPASYPGLPNPGHFGFSKLLGFVELDKAKAPTDVAVGTDFDGANAERSGADLSTETGREPFADAVATSGYAVVASRAERYLEWIDLSPLLQGFQESYFSGDPAVYASPGAADEQWPPVFASRDDLAPKPAATTKLDTAPISVAHVGGSAFVADDAGTVFAYDPTKPADAEPTGSLSLDGAITCLSPTADGKEVLATSRADRSVSWIKPAENDPSVSRTLRDKRMQDPLCAIDNPETSTFDDTGSRARTVSVADFDGGALHTYRYGAGKLADGTALDLGKNSYLYGGSYEPKGKPFTVTTTVDSMG